MVPASGNRPDRQEGEFKALAELADAFTALVHAVHSGDPARFTAQRIITVAAGCMPQAKATDLLVSERGGLRSIASAGELAEAVARTRRDVGEGPSLDVLETNELVITGDLSQDERWPQFAHQATRDSGVHSIASYRLYLGPQHRAALTFYSDWPHAFDELAIATGSIFAAYCSLALLTDLLLADTVSPRRAGEVHREIGVAIGLLMSTGEVSDERAYHQLHEASRRVRDSMNDEPEAGGADDALPREDDQGGEQHEI